jgi:hypothetical protein
MTLIGTGASLTDLRGTDPAKAVTLEGTHSDHELCLNFSRDGKTIELWWTGR